MIVYNYFESREQACRFARANGGTVKLLIRDNGQITSSGIQAMKNGYGKEEIEKLRYSVESKIKI